MYVQCNINARSRNHCCRGKAINVTYFNTLWTGDADLRLYITIVQDG